MMLQIIYFRAFSLPVCYKYCRTVFTKPDDIHGSAFSSSRLLPKFFSLQQIPHGYIPVLVKKRSLASVRRILEKLPLLRYGTE